MVLKQETKLIQALIREVQSGKRSAFEQLYKTHVSRIYTFGLKIFEHNRHASEELTKRVFVNAFKQISAYPESMTFILWLRMLAVYEVREGDIEKAIEQHETGAVEKAVFLLPVEERIIFIFHDIDKLPVEEIKIITKDSIEHINIELDRARKLMIEKLSIKRLDDLFYKISFLPQKTEPRHEFWNLIFNEINKTEQVNSGEKNEEKDSIVKKIAGLFRKKT